MKHVSRIGRVALPLLALVALVLAGMLWIGSNTQAATAVSGAITAKAGSGGTTTGLFVKLSAAGTVVTATAATDSVVGVCDLTASADGLTRYAPPGTMATVTSGGGIAVGNLLTATTGGKAVALGTDYATTQRYGAMALSAASGADEAVTCLVVAGATPALSVMPSATVAATGSTQAHAIADGLMSTGFTLVSAADATKGVALPVAAAGKICIVKNNAAAVLKVWPNTGDAINAIAANTNIAMASLTSAVFVSYDATTWYTIPLLPS